MAKISHPVPVTITLDSKSQLLEKIYLACLKADKERVQEYMMTDAINLIFKVVSLGHNACKKSSIFLERLEKLLPAMIHRFDDFHFPSDLPQLVDEVANSVNPLYQMRTKDH